MGFLLSFDASVNPNGNLGIGMYDITNKIKKHQGGMINEFSSIKGETAALTFTLDYAKDNNLTRLNLYTDNLHLATKSIEGVLKDYNFIDVKLTWVPRELNMYADKLSKNGQKTNENKNISQVFVGTSANQTRKIKEPAKDEKIEGTLKVFKGWSYNKKVSFLSKLAKSNELELIKMLKLNGMNGVNSDCKFNVNNTNKVLVSMVKTLLMDDPGISEYTRKSLKSLKNSENNKRLPTLSFKEFKEEFDKRKPKKRKAA